MFAAPAAPRKWEPWWKFWAQPLKASKYSPTRTASTPLPDCCLEFTISKFPLLLFYPLCASISDCMPAATPVVNVTLNTMFEAIQIAPAQKPTENDDDWKWVLRSVSNRPILRLVDDPPRIINPSHGG